MILLLRREVPTSDVKDCESGGRTIGPGSRTGLKLRNSGCWWSSYALCDIQMVLFYEQILINCLARHLRWFCLQVFVIVYISCLADCTLCSRHDRLSIRSLPRVAARNPAPTHSAQGIRSTAQAAKLYGCKETQGVHISHKPSQVVPWKVCI